MHRLNKIGQIIWQVIFVLVYPIITVFSLLFTGIIMLFSSLSSLISRLASAREVEREKKTKEEQWETWWKTGEFLLQAKIAGEVLFGPSYYKVKAQPVIRELEVGYWGKEIFPYKSGCFLQKWVSVKEHELDNFILVFLDPLKRELIEIVDLPTYEWTFELKSNNQLIVLYEYAGQKKEYIIEKAGSFV